MRTGSILEVVIKNEKKDKPGATMDKVDTRRWVKCADHDAPKSVALDITSQRVFVVTENGNFQVWNLKTFDVIFTKNF
jgi:hypothetical protein